MVWLGFVCAALIAGCLALQAVRGRPAALCFLKSRGQRTSTAASATALALTTIALAGPRWGQEERPVLAGDRTFWLCLDVSRSMLAADVPGNRLERGRALLLETVDSLVGDRVGVIAFAGDARVVCPPTRDLAHVRDELAGLSIDSAPPGGSKLAAAVTLVARRKDRNSDSGSRVLVLASDGAESSAAGSDPGASRLEHDATNTGRGQSLDNAVAEANAANLVIVTIGVGDPQRSTPIEIEGAGPLVEVGQIVRTRLAEAPLQELADGTGGFYVPAGTRMADLPAILRQRLSPRLETLDARLHQPATAQQYQWFLLPALLLAIIEPSRIWSLLRIRP